MRKNQIVAMRNELQKTNFQRKMNYKKSNNELQNQIVAMRNELQEIKYCQRK